MSLNKVSNITFNVQLTYILLSTSKTVNYYEG